MKRTLGTLVKRALTPLPSAAAEAPPLHELAGFASTTADEPLRSPASGTACVFWQLRITESVTPALMLVHNVTSPEPFHVERRESEAPEGRRGSVERVLVASAEARVFTVPTLHWEGSPGALAVARAFGLIGQVRVEETCLRANEAVEATGVLIHPERGRGPFRGTGGDIQLCDAEIRTLGRSGAAQWIPYAVATGALVLSAMAAIHTAVRALDDSRHLLDLRELRSLVVPEIGRSVPVRPRWP